VPLDAPIVSFRGHENLQIHVQPTQITHINDIVIHFRTSKDDGVIFTTWNGHNNDYMKAYLQGGHVHLDTFIERSGREVRHHHHHRRRHYCYYRSSDLRF